MIHIDDNHISVGLGKSSVSGTLPFLIDNVTDRLMIEVYPIASSGSLIQNHASKDDNHSNTITGASDVDGTPMAAAVNSANGFLIVDLIQE